MKKIIVLIFIGLSILYSHTDYFSDAMNAFYNGNYSKSINLYKKACKYKNTGACYNLGVYYFEGKIIDVNYTISKNYFYKACKYDNLGCRKYKYLQKEGY